MKYSLSPILISVFFLILTLLHFKAHSQTRKYYVVTCKMMNGSIEKAFLYKVNNQYIYLMSEQFRKNVDSIKAEHISSITVKRKGKMGSSIGFWAAAGSVAGGILGATTYTPCTSFFCVSPTDTQGGRAAAYAVLGALSGALLGVIPGSLNNFSCKIEGNPATYQKYVPKLKKYTVEERLHN